MMLAGKHPREQERLVDLRSYNILDTEAEAIFDQITELAVYISGTTSSVISFIDEERQWFKARQGFDVSYTSRDISFCSHTILGEDIIEVEDALLDERFNQNPAVLFGPKIRFYAGVPLISGTGLAIGTLCVFDAVPKKLSDEQRKNLQTLASQVMELLEFRKLKSTQELKNCIFANMNDTLKSIKVSFEDCECQEEEATEGQCFDLSKVLKNVIDLSKTVRTEKKVYMFSHIDEGTVIKGDLSEVSKALLYLLKGSLRALEEDRESMRLISVKMKHVTGGIEIEFIDNGKRTDRSESDIAKILMSKSGGYLSFEEDHYSKKFKIMLPQCA